MAAAHTTEIESGQDSRVTSSDYWNISAKYVKATKAKASSIVAPTNSNGAEKVKSDEHFH